MKLCTICSHPVVTAFSTLVLNAHEARFIYCEQCGLLQAEYPHWLAEAYSSPIALADTGILQRNYKIWKQLSKVLYLLFDRNGSYLDMAGGYGVLVRLMRDSGFDYYWSDKYADNIHAKGFEADFASDRSFEAVTAFEVMEHIEDPVKFIQDAMNVANTDTFIFTTELFDGAPPAPNEWWYYAFESGQHISFYQRKTLQSLADRLGLKLHSYKSFHILTKNDIRPFMFRLSMASNFDIVFNRLVRWGMQSKTMSDHRRLLDQRSR